MQQTVITSHEVLAAMKQDNVHSVAAYLGAELGSFRLNDAETLAVLETLHNLLYGILKENGVELVNDWE